MRKIWLLASTVLAFLNFVKSQEVARTLYSPRYDNLDIDTILSSNRLVSNYVDCLLSRKPCPPEGKDLKRILPEALRTKCARCSPIQKENALKIITRLYFDYPDQYRALRERWDPSGEYHRRFEEYLRGLQFNQIGGNGAGPGAPAGGSSGNTLEGGNDRPVRNDLDRQPAASQSSNVQAVVVDPTLLPSGNVNTLLATATTTTTTTFLPPPAPQPAFTQPATERPRPPAPVAQILFPTTTTVTSDRIPTTSDWATTTTTTPSTTTTSATTTSTSTSLSSGPVELTSGTPGAVPDPSNGGLSALTSLLSTVSGDGASESTTPPPFSATAGQPDDATVAPTRPPAPAAASPPLVVVSRFGEDGSGTPARPEVPTTASLTTTQRPTTTVRQTRPATRQTTTRNTQRTTTRFITRVPPTWAPTPPRTWTTPTTTTRTTTTSTTLPPRPPPPPPPPAQQQPLPQAPLPPRPQAYPPSILYERPQVVPPKATAPPLPPPPPPPAPSAPNRPTYATAGSPATSYDVSAAPDSIIDRFFVPPSQAANPPLPPSPIVGLWNQLGSKIADTADAIAGMLQKTVDVLVTSHLQSHQRALRRT